MPDDVSHGRLIRRLEATSQRVGQKLFGGAGRELVRLRHEEASQVRGQLPGGGVAVRRVPGDRLEDDRLQVRRNEPVELAKQAMRQLNSLTGFERLFLCDDRGSVIASNQKLDLDDASETIRMARLIADRDAEQVPLVGDEEHELLSKAEYAAPTSEEVQRLAELGVAATIALPLRIDGDLVGALHAFNSFPKRVGAERRSVAHLFAERLVARMARRGWGEYTLAP